MRLPLEWLSEYVAVRLAPEALAERLTMAGHEVKAIEGGGKSAVFELEITPNRADCLSIIGLAREVAAITGQRFTAVKVGATRSSSRRKQTLVRIEDKKGCRRYVGRLLEDVRVGPSPDWMQRRLLACGARPINNLVDITNYVLFEYGQPLHAFDCDRLEGGGVVVRRAKAGERITTLEGTTHELSADMLIIADSRQPVAVAGVMGGQGSEVIEPTRRVLLESAWFDPVVVRRTGRALGLASESSYRFERGIDPEGVLTASARAAGLIRELAGGNEVMVVDAGAAASERRTVIVEPERLNKWLGASVSAADLRSLFAKLGCRVLSGGRGTLSVTVPGYRRDLVQPVDLYEEAARLVGYDRIPSRVPVVPVSAPPAGSTESRRIEQVQDACVGLGLIETVSWSLLSPDELARARCGARLVKLVNPLSQDAAVLQPSLLPAMLNTARRNVAHGADGLRLFEVAHTFQSGRHPEEQPQLGLLLWGTWLQDWRSRQPADFFRLKGLLQALGQRLAGGEILTAPTASGAGPAPWAEPSAQAALVCRGTPVGWAGLVRGETTKTLDIPGEVWYAELELNSLAVRPVTSVKRKAAAMFPPVKRDVSALVPQQHAFRDIEAGIREAGQPCADRVALIDRYTGGQVPGGMVSLTFSIEYRDASRTLTAEEVEAIHQRVTRTLAERFGATLR